MRFWVYGEGKETKASSFCRFCAAAMLTRIALLTVNIADDQAKSSTFPRRGGGSRIDLSVHSLLVHYHKLAIDNVFLAKMPAPQVAKSLDARVKVSNAILYSTLADFQLSDGHSIPQFGLGVYEMNDDETYKCCKWALEAGYKHIDTAEW